MTKGVANLSGASYPGCDMGRMKGITIKLPEPVARQLREEARRTGRSIAALVRERIESPLSGAQSVYSITADLAGSLAGQGVPATNARRRFHRRDDNL